MIIELGLASVATKGTLVPNGIEYTSNNQPLNECSPRFTVTPGTKFTCS